MGLISSFNLYNILITITLMLSYLNKIYIDHYFLIKNDINMSFDEIW